MLSTKVDTRCDVFILVVYLAVVRRSLRIYILDSAKS